MMALIGYAILIAALGLVVFTLWAIGHPSARERQRAMFREIACGCRHGTPHGKPDRRCRLCAGRGSYLRRIR